MNGPLNAFCKSCLKLSNNLRLWVVGNHKILGKSQIAMSKLHEDTAQFPAWHAETYFWHGRSKNTKKRMLAFFSLAWRFLNCVSFFIVNTNLETKTKFTNILISILRSLSHILCSSTIRLKWNRNISKPFVFVFHRSTKHDKASNYTFYRRSICLDWCIQKIRCTSHLRESACNY